MNGLEHYCKKALEMGIDGAKLIEPGSVITAEWVRMKCQFGCPGFRKRLCCPPHTPTPVITRRVIDSYKKAILFHKGLKNSEERLEQRKVFNETIVYLEKEIFLDGYYKAWSMGSGACRLCKECNPTGLCKHGFRARPPMEACGIDVFKTARDNGFPIEVVRTREGEMNVFGLILVG
jgi:predicted metal-binding protein